MTRNVQDSGLLARKLNVCCLPNEFQPPLAAWISQLYDGARAGGALEMAARSVTDSLIRGSAGLAVTATSSSPRSATGSGSVSEADPSIAASSAATGSQRDARYWPA